MSNYYTIIPHTIWVTKLKELNFREKLLYIYLMTNEKTHLTGIYHVSIWQINQECGLKPNTIKKALKALISNSLITYWEDENLVYVKGLFKDKVEKIKDISNINEIIQKRRELIKNAEVWKMFDSEYKKGIIKIKNGDKHEE
jgi:hypothetical protein